MEKRIITILKKEDRLMSLSEIVSELNKKTESSIKDEDVRPILKKLCEKNIISIVSTVNGDKYCYVEISQSTPENKTPVATNPEIKKINTKIGIIGGLIAVVFIGFILFVYGLSLAGGWDGHGDFTLGGIGTILFFVANIILGFLAGPAGKFTKNFEGAMQHNADQIKGDSTVGQALDSGCAWGCGGILNYFTYMIFGFIGFIFGFIAIKKLNDKKNNLK